MPLVEVTPAARRILLEELRRTGQPDSHAVLIVDEPNFVQHSLGRFASYINRVAPGRWLLMLWIAVRWLLSPHKRQLRPYAFPLEKARTDRLVDFDGIRIQFFHELYASPEIPLKLDAGRGALVVMDETGAVLAPKDGACGSQ